MGSLRVVLVDGEVYAESHGPWCEDGRTFPPPPKCYECSSPAEPPSPHWQMVRHQYEPTSVPRWRTCAVCGLGANAQVHK